MANRLEGDTVCTGTFSPLGFNCPAEALADAAIELPSPGNGINAEKVIHQFAHHLNVAPGTTVTALTQLLHTLYGTAGKVIDVRVITTAPPSGDHTVTVDLQKGNAGSGFASILSGLITINSSTAARTPVAGTVTSPTLAAGDTLELIVAVAGSTGSQAQGLLVTVTIDESPT